MTTDFGSNLISNPSLSTTTSGWTNDQGTVMAGNTQSPAVLGRFDDGTGSANRQVAYTTVSNIVPSTGYSLSGVSFYSRTAAPSSRFGLKVEWRNSSDVVVGTAWSGVYNFSISSQTIARQELTAPAGAFYARIYVIAGDTTAFSHRATNFVFKRAADPPTANITGATTGQVGSIVVLSSSGGDFTPVWSSHSGAPGHANPTIVNQYDAGPFTATGTYTYEVMVQDSPSYLTDTDTHTITVSAGNPPVANAGVNQTVFAGDSITLSGAASAANGLHASPWQWSEVTSSGATITSPTSQSTTVGPFDTTGTYVFQLRAKDSTNLYGDDTMTVEVIIPPNDLAPYNDRIRLQLLADPRINQISNHSGSASATTGWTAVSGKGSVSAVAVSGGNAGRALRLTANSSGYGAVHGTNITAAPGEYFVAGFMANTTATAARVIAKVESYLSDGTTITGSTSRGDWVYAGQDDVQIEFVIPAAQVAGAAYIRLVVEIDGGNGAGTNPSAQVNFWNTYLFKGDSWSDVYGFGFVESGETWQELLADSTSISIDRGADMKGVTDENKPGILTARMVNAGSTPENNPRMRPGHTIRCMAFNRVSNDYEYLFSGKVTEASSDWSSKEPVVTLTATDALSELGNYPVALIEGGVFEDRVNSVMETVGVLYEVEDTATSAPTGQTLSYDESGTALSQLELTVNTEHGQMFVRKDGVLQLRALNSVGTAGSATFSDDPMDSGIDFFSADVSFDSKNLINSLTIKQKGIGEEAEDAVYGPFNNVASISDWGVQKAEVEVNDYDAEYHGEFYLSIFPEPRLTCRSLKFEVGDNIHLATDLELFKAARVHFTAAGLDDYFRILSIKHDITPNKWIVEVTFRPLEDYTPVTIGLPANGWGTKVSDSVPEEYQTDTGWIDITYATGYNNGSGSAPGQMRIRRIGKTVFLDGGVTKNSGAFVAGTYETVNAFALPEHFRPAVNYRNLVPGTSIRPASLLVSDAGLIQVTTANGVTGGGWISTAGSWSTG